MMSANGSGAHAQTGEGGRHGDQEAGQGDHVVGAPQALGHHVGDQDHSGSDGRRQHRQQNPCVEADH